MRDTVEDKVNLWLVRLGVDRSTGAALCWGFSFLQTSYMLIFSCFNIIGLVSVTVQCLSI